MKRECFALTSVLHDVTPRAGVWIETPFEGRLEAAPTVTPRAGVWIETVDTASVPHAAESPPVRGCGLKHVVHFVNE